MFLNFMSVSNPFGEPDKKTPFSETIVMFTKRRLEIEPSVEDELRGQVVIYIGSALPHQDGS